MLDRQHGLIIFECDACGEVLETDERGFPDAKAALDRADWRARKLGVDWIHHCPDCGELT